jgi:LacI family transcriptional regulator
MHKGRNIIVLIAPTRAYDRGLLRGFARYANLHGPWIIHREAPFDRQWDWQEKVTPRLRSGEIDGIIMREPERLEEIMESGVPAICAPYSRRVVPGMINVVTDNAAVGRMGAQHLRACEFRHFAFVGLDGFLWSQERYNSFRQALQQEGHPVHLYQPPQAEETQQQWELELPFMVEWLTSLPKPVGIMTCNDERSHHVSDACRAAGIAVPGSVAILGADDDEITCGLSNPPLSSIALNPEDAAFRAAGLLDHLMAGRTIPEYIVVGEPSHHVTRQSTDITAVDDRITAEALRFIKTHSARDIHVPEIAEAVTLSRRTLEEHFQEVMGESLQGEINIARANRVATMLLETQLSVSQIGEQLGFSSTKQLTRLFKQQTQLTPTAYRQKHDHA